ncbi:hypothetical protein B0H12DRAFT_1286929 [Mycena haematopus]|nr:hypothetical protein B0H12DRAFT_1286929 [Mycena haematopus]
MAMAEFALINIDKCEVINAVETGHGSKMKEVIANWMSFDVLWLFAVPADDQPAPPPSTSPPKSFFFARVPVGHWAGDRVLIVNEYTGDVKTNLPADMLAKFTNVHVDGDVRRFAFKHLKQISFPGYKHAGESDVLFPLDRVWVVRNLTKGWYARSDVLIDAKDRRGPHSTGRLGLGDLIWADIGGSMSGGVGKGGRGDRFDIQTLATVENSKDGTEWKDLSKKAKLCLRSFYEGDDVRELRA